jgi:6-pyruvoyltetrahydropterin/6-carboxytetrahydropterin synthase
MNRQDRLNHTFRLWKDFSFEAAHQLTKVPTGHQCGNLHGHSYKVRVHCEGKLDARMEWVVDYAEIGRAVRPIIEKLDHTFLNHHLDFETTAENLAWWLAETIAPKLPQLAGVEVFETPTTSVLCAWQRNENAKSEAQSPEKRS